MYGFNMMAAIKYRKYEPLLHLLQILTLKSRGFCIRAAFSVGISVFFCYIYFYISKQRFNFIENCFCAQESATQQREFKCFDKNNNYKITQKGKYWVLYNYVRASKWFKCHESITYTTIGDLSFLENLKPLVERWQGPVSVAVYTPGTDLMIALNNIKYLHKCSSPLIATYVSFHLYFEADHQPKSIPKPVNVLDDHNVNCEVAAPWYNLNITELYRTKKKLYFPINVGRNIARDAATTHYLLASDIELYPSANIIHDFLEMIRQKEVTWQTGKLEVFVLPPFEVKKDAIPPLTKEELVKMLAEKTAVEFHKAVCAQCHQVPKIHEWIKTNVTNGLHKFHTVKKKGMWEPFYIGTNAEPYFDERLSWEGRCNKLTQAYSMCVLDYDYHILDNAFLVHRPGIKKFVNDPIRYKAFSQTLWQIRNKIRPEIHELYGWHENCSAMTWFG